MNIQKIYEGSAEKTKRVYAPYNFVPFGKRVLQRYASMEELPALDKRDPSLLSGELRVTLTAKTPIFVSNGQGGARGNGEVDFFRGGDGRYQIPAATMRGLLRQNMQVLGMGQVRPGWDIADNYLYYRAMADAKESLKGDLSAKYQKSLGVKVQHTPQGKQFSQATNVKAAIVTFAGKTYTLQPVRYLPIPALVEKKPNRLLQDGGLQQWTDKYAAYTEVWYRVEGATVVSLCATQAPGLQRGYLLRPGYMKNQNLLYLFCAPDKEGKSLSLDAFGSDILDYKNDYELRQNSLAGTNAGKPMDREFWKLPEQGCSKPMFYLECDGHLALGMTQFLRTTFHHRLGECLPDVHCELAKQTVLDYPNSIMGFADKESAYRSRVRVGAFCAPATARVGSEINAILAAPKPTFFGGYAFNKDAANKIASYSEDGTQLRGYKQYWLKEKTTRPVVEKGKEKVATVLKPLPAGTTFTGTIHYENLHEDELGLLLWALLLDEGCCQTIGMGKPLGMGRVQVKLDALVEDTDTLYTKLDASGKTAPDPLARARQLCASYQQYADRILTEMGAAKRKKGKSAAILRGDPSVQYFLYIKSTVVADDDKAYFDNMKLTQFRKLSQPLPLLSEFARSDAPGGEKTPQKKPDDPAPGGKKKPPRGLAALLNY